jgi:hypothetical protein
LIGAHWTTQLQLGSVRRAEPMLFDDLAEEADELHALTLPDAKRIWGTAIRNFHHRRIAVADKLAALVGRST